MKTKEDFTNYWINKLGRNYMTRKEIEKYFEVYKASSLRAMDYNGTGIDNKYNIGKVVVYPIKDIIDFVIY